MSRFAFFLPLLLVACGSGPDDAQEVSAGADAQDAVVAGDTHLVDNPPVYESKPLPEGLEWLTNDEDPTFAAEDAIRGGTYRSYMTSYPLTLRLYGPNASSGEFVPIKRAMSLSLVNVHPNTLNIIPELATHWAIGEDGRTVYYRLDPRARWSDGEPVTADDYLFQREFQLSEFTLEPYGANYYSTEVVDVSKYDDYTISVTHAVAKPVNELIFATAMSPSPRHFHKLDENWVTDYNWRVAPNTGPYRITAMESGRFIEYSRKADWWGDELKYFENRFNPETLRLVIIRDETVAFEYFMRGELDRFDFTSTLPALWHEQATGTAFDNGYIGKIQFYVDVPHRARGLWLNTADPILSDINVRLGLAHALDFDSVLRTVFRGDYERLQQINEGYYWGYSNPDIRARPFDLTLADGYLDAAGWTGRAADGIRTKDGQRLTIRVSYGTDEHTPWLVVLRESAKKAGIELALQLLDPSAWGTQVGEKTYQATYINLGTSLTPSPWQAWHSDNANKPQTNNFTNTADPALDALIDEYEAATVLEERVELAHRIQEMVHETAAFIPTFKIPFVREAFWRWAKLPEHHSVRTAEELFDPFVVGLMWIDEEERAAVLQARDARRQLEPIDIVDTTWRVP